MEFGNPIVGSEDLIRSAIKSPDFNTDPESGNVTGWRIARDGSATFYNLTIGSTNFNIDQDGNAVFQQVSAAEILLNGVSLSDTLTAMPRGMLAVTSCPTSSAAYNGTTPVVVGRVAIPNFDITRQYRLGWILHIDKGTSTPLYYGLQGRLAFGSLPTTSTSTFFITQVATGQSEGATNEGTSYDNVDIGTHVFNNTTPANDGQTCNICLTLTAETAGPRMEGESYNRVWVEDVGPAVEYGSYNPATDAAPTQQYVKTYSANWSASYQSDGDNRNVSECYQGYYSGTNGNQYSLIGLPYATIQSDLSGATINKVEVYLNNNHWYSNSGGTAVIGTHTYSTEPSTASLANVDEDINRSSFTYGQAKWVTVSNAIGTALKNNTAKGIALGPGPSTSTAYYGYFAGNGQSGEPQVRITYTK